MPSDTLFFGPQVWGLIRHRDVTGISLARLFLINSKISSLLKTMVHPDQSSATNEVSQLLDAVRRGEVPAADLLPVVYDQLRKLAGQKLAQEKPGQTLQATALVHEAYLRLVGKGGDSTWDDRGHFFAAAAEAMRRILVERARHKSALKQGGGRVRQNLDELELAAPETREDLLALDEALQKLAQTDPAAAKLVDLRYFAGLTIPECAQVLAISPRTADRLWAFARAWLHREIQGANPDQTNS